MRLLQKLEISLGIAFFVSLLVKLFFVDIPLAQSMGHDADGYFKTEWFWMNLLLSAVVIACSYFHSSRKSYLAFAILLVTLLPTSFFRLTIAIVFDNSLMGHVLIGTMPIFISLVTTVVAIANTIYFIREDHPTVVTDISSNLKRSYRLQLFFGIAALAVYSMMGTYLLLTDEFAKKNIIPIIIFGLICPFLAAFGSFLQTIKQNDYGLLVIFLAFIVALFLELVSGHLFKIVISLINLGTGMLAKDYYMDIPYILVLITTIFALNSLRLKYRFF